MNDNRGPMTFAGAVGVLLGKIVGIAIMLSGLALIGMFVWNIGVGSIVKSATHISFLASLSFMTPIYILHKTAHKYYYLHLNHKQTMLALHIMKKQVEESEKHGTD